MTKTRIGGGDISLNLISRYEYGVCSFSSFVVFFTFVLVGDGLSALKKKSQECILAGKFDVNDPEIQAQITGGHVGYDVAKCTMVSELQQFLDGFI